MKSAARKTKPGAGKTVTKRKPKKQAIVLSYRRGAACPQCKTGRLDYNGLLELACDKCDFVLSGGAGCT
jgi:uncharacterized protein (DUF983 family)